VAQRVAARLGFHYLDSGALYRLVAFGAIQQRMALDDEPALARLAASLDVRLPEDFLLADADPQPDDTRGLRWTLGALDRGDHVTITLRGHLYGTPEQPARITATAVYRPGNFNADFETRSEATTILGASPIALTLVGPPRSVPGTDITYTIHAAHTGTTTSPVIRIALDVPRTFVLRESNPKRASEHELAWVLSELTPGAERTITVRGHFTAGAATPYDLRATATITPSGGRALTLSQATTQTEVLGSAVALLTTVNDQTSGFSAHAGDTIRFRIVARNDGAAPIRSLVVRTVFDATSVAEKSILNFGAITDSANGTAVGEQLAPRLRRGTVTWTATEIPTLADVAPGEQRTIDLAIPLHTPTTLPGMSDHGTITFHAALTVGSIADTATPFTITTTPIAITVQ
ncbi:MAG: (d)CMP kinase, partial [Phycisphaerales bacterium]|nr:(d)CMP kinase [Phycisphaerales bacterium]